jgi:hypothetical protein
LYLFFFPYLIQEKLFSSRNRTEVSLGKKLKMNFLPEIEEIHKVFYGSSHLGLFLVELDPCACTKSTAFLAEEAEAA